MEPTIGTFLMIMAAAYVANCITELTNGAATCVSNRVIRRNGNSPSATNVETGEEIKDVNLEPEHETPEQPEAAKATS